MNLQPTLLQHSGSTISEGAYDVNLSPFINESPEWREQYSYFTSFQWGLKMGELRRVGSIKRVPFDNTFAGAISALTTCVESIRSLSPSEADSLQTIVDSLSPEELGFNS